MDALNRTKRRDRAGQGFDVYAAFDLLQPEFSDPFNVAIEQEGREFIPGRPV